MAEYRKSEAREWAKANMRGVANVIIPTFTHDLRKLNERAIRHDVRKEIEYGFWGNTCDIGIAGEPRALKAN